MLKNKIIGKKIRNIIVLLMAIIVMIGAYRYIDRSRAEKVIEIDAVALDNYGYLEDEEFKLEAKQLDDGSYEIELPESVNTKKINRIVKIGLGELEKTSTENQETILLIVFEIQVVAVLYTFVPHVITLLITVSNQVQIFPGNWLKNVPTLSIQIGTFVIK